VFVVFLLHNRIVLCFIRRQRKKREVVEEEEDKEKKISVEIDSFCTK
jgi:hypothetical protein